MGLQRIGHDCRQAWDKLSLSKFRSTEIMSSVFSDHKAMKRENHSQIKKQREKNYMEIKNMLLKKASGAKMKPKRKFKNRVRPQTMETHPYRDFPGGAVVENPYASARNMGLIPGVRRSYLPWSI